MSEKIKLNQVILILNPEPEDIKKSAVVHDNITEAIAGLVD